VTMWPINTAKKTKHYTAIEPIITLLIRSLRHDINTVLPIRVLLMMSIPKINHIWKYRRMC